MSRGGLRRAWRDLTGRSYERFVDLLGKQVEAAQKAGRQIRGALGDDDPGAVARQLMHDAEQIGDEARHALVDELARAVSTPIDREDLFRLSRSIDDVLDNLRDFARELDLYCPERGVERFNDILDVIGDALAALGEAVGELGNIEKVPEAAMRAGKASNEVRRRYQAALQDLFGAELDMDVLKARELLRRLDVAGLRLHEASDALADGAWKRNQ